MNQNTVNTDLCYKMNKLSEKILDEWLISSADLNNKRAFNRLIERWYPKLLGYACCLVNDSELARDITQETLLHVSKSIHQLKDPQSFPKWIYTILQRRCTDAIRDGIKARNRQAEDGMTHIDNALEPNRINIEEEKSIEQALKYLSKKEHQVVRLFYLEGFDVREIAEIISIPEGTVKSKLYYARKKLSELL